MKAKYVLIPALLLSLVACDRPDKSVRNPTADYDAENAIENIQDQNQKMIAPLTESKTESDRKIAQELRQAIMADRSLSNDAKNISISVNNGVVTLRGVVYNSQEKNTIEKKISSIRDIKRVDNQIEVKTKK